METRRRKRKKKKRKSGKENKSNLFSIHAKSVRCITSTHLSYFLSFWKTSPFKLPLEIKIYWFNRITSDAKSLWVWCRNYYTAKCNQRNRRPNASFVLQSATATSRFELMGEIDCELLILAKAKKKEIVWFAQRAIDPLHFIGIGYGVRWPLSLSTFDFCHTNPTLI